MTLTEILISFVIAIVGGLLTTYLYAKINSESIKHYLFMGLSLFCFLSSLYILIFIFLKNMELSLAFLIIILLLNVSSLIFLRLHILKNGSYESNKQLIDIAYFKEQALVRCGDEIGDTLTEIAIAFNEIESIFNKSYIRGVSNPKKTKSTHFNEGLGYGKETTILESDIEEIYERMIDRLKFHKGIISTDINMKTGNTLNGKYRWIADGLDGGLHFLRNISVFTSSIALQKKEGKNWITIIGAVLVPTTNEFFFAVKDKGAYLNNWNAKLPIVDRTDKLDKCIFYIESPNINTVINDGKQKYEDCNTLIKNINCKINKNRNYNVGSYGLAYLAKGSWDAYISLHGTTSMYDSEAGKLLVEESGKDEEKPTMVVIKEDVRDIDGIDTGSRIFATSEKILNSIKEDKDLYPDVEKVFPNFKS